jgi:hypothetical protein
MRVNRSAPAIERALFIDWCEKDCAGEKRSPPPMPRDAQEPRDNSRGGLPQSRRMHLGCAGLRLRARQPAAAAVAAAADARRKRIAI